MDKSEYLDAIAEELAEALASGKYPVCVKCGANLELSVSSTGDVILCPKCDNLGEVGKMR